MLSITSFPEIGICISILGSEFDHGVNNFECLELAFRVTRVMFNPVVTLLCVTIS